MYPNGPLTNDFWGVDSLVASAAFFDWRKDYSNLPDEVKEYLTEHENEIHSEEDVDHLVHTYNMKK